MLNAVDKSKLRRMLEQGEKLKAIRFVMQQTGVCLSEAKHYVETLDITDMRAEKVVYPPEPRTIDSAVTERVCALLAQGEQVKAIAYLREQTGMSLEEARQYTQPLAAQIDRDKQMRQAQESSKNMFAVMKRWSPAQKALLFAAIFVLPFLFMYLMMRLDTLLS